MAVKALIVLWPVPSVAEELRQLEGKLIARCAQCGAQVLHCSHGKTLRDRLRVLRGGSAPR